MVMALMATRENFFYQLKLQMGQNLQQILQQKRNVTREIFNYPVTLQKRFFRQTQECLLFLRFRKRFSAPRFLIEADTLELRRG
jgi:hypothetical protein